MTFRATAATEAHKAILYLQEGLRWQRQRGVKRRAAEPPLPRTLQLPFLELLLQPGTMQRRDAACAPLFRPPCVSAAACGVG